MKILLIGHGGSSNRGCEAIVRSTIDIINHYLRETEITIMSRDPSSDRAALFPDLENVSIPDIVTDYPQKHSFQWLAKGLDRRVIQRILPGLPSYFSIVNRSFYRGKDVVISIGGDNFCYEMPSHFFGELALARTLGSLTVIWAATISPFQTRRLEKIWAKRLRKVDLITVRDSISLEYLRSIGVVENVRHVADPAFLLSAKAEGASLLSSFKSHGIIGIGMSALIPRYVSGSDKYVSAFTSFGKALLSDTNTRLVLVPHVVSKIKDYDDESICRQLASRIGEYDRIIIIDRNNNSSQLKYIIAQCDYFIGARTHSTISSLSSLVPTLSIGYSAKAYGINEDIFGHSDYVLSTSNLNEKSLYEKFMLLCKNRRKIIQKLRRRIPILKNMANQGGNYLKEILNSHGYHIQSLDSMKDNANEKP